MATFGLVPWRDIRKMLDACIPGWKYEDKPHKRWIYFKDFPIFKMPLGPHGKRTHHDVQIGHVRALVRHFGIEECAKRYIKQL